MTVLYRKYRPASWIEVVGQDHIVEALKDSIKLKRISHAYLFSGSRGTGKTSIARILAKALETADEDVYEIDAASNRGIDDIRSLREHVSVMPFSSAFKVYIIDEVHMLSKDAWNALLKTLEEPPKHVIFILATTEIEKVPETIVSRCQTFVFRKPGREVLRKEVEMIAKKEGYTLDPDAADLVALLGDGSFRDALGTLEKVISSSSDKKLSREEVEAITGAPRSMLVNSFIGSVLAKDVDGALRVLNSLDNSGLSMEVFTTLVLEKMRFILLATHSSSAKALIKERVSSDDWVIIEKLSLGKAMTPAILSEFLEAADRVSRASVSSIPLELATIKICG